MFFFPCFLFFIIIFLYNNNMEYAELNVYNVQGGEAFIKKNIDEKGLEKLSEEDKKILRKYKKKIIEQRNEIEQLKRELEKYKRKK
tara:strand:- start:59 stop:316 length:258 start_codon:yes stop_codon:yes gene_type:complete